MKRLMTILLCGLLLVSLGCLGEKKPKGVLVQGKITAYGEAIADAVVIALGTGENTLSDADGQFALTLLPGKYTLEVSRVGYHTATREITVTEEPLTGIDFSLEDAPFFDVDFDDEELGAFTEIPGVRSYTDYAPVIVESPGDRPGKSVYFDGKGVESGRNAENFYYELPEPVRDQLTVEAWVYPTGTTRSIALSVSNEDNFGEDDAVSLYFFDNNTIQYFADGWNLVTSYTPHQWLRVKVVVDVPNQTYDIYVNDMENKITTAPFRNKSRTEMLRVGFFMFVAQGTEPSPAYVDSLMVRRRDL